MSKYLKEQVAMNPEKWVIVLQEGNGLYTASVSMAGHVIEGKSTSPAVAVKRCMQGIGIPLLAYPNTQVLEGVRAALGETDIIAVFSLSRSTPAEERGS